MALQLIYLFGALVLGTEALVLAFLYRRVGMAAIFLAAVAQGVNPQPIPIHLSVTLYAPDLVFALLAVAAVMRLGNIRRGLQHPVIIAVLAAAIAWSAFRGIHAFPKTLVASESRDLFYLLIGPAYLVSFGRGDRLRRELLTLMIWLGSAFSLVAAYHAATGGIGSANTGTLVNGAFESTRIVNGAQAMAIGVAVCICTYRWWEDSSPRYLGLALWLLAWVTLAQQRTVWVATIAGLTALFVLTPLGSKIKLVALAVYAGILLLPFAVYGPLHPVLNTLAESWATVSGSKTSYTWREAGWADLLVHFRATDRLTQMQGWPFGFGYGRAINGQLVTVSPHNFYVTLLLRTGFVGLGAYLVVLIGSLFPREERALRWSMVAFLATYSWGYSPGFFAVPVLAWLVSSAAQPAEMDQTVAPETSFQTVPSDHIGLDRVVS